MKKRKILISVVLIFLFTMCMYLPYRSSDAHRQYNSNRVNGICAGISDRIHAGILRAADFRIPEYQPIRMHLFQNNSDT